MLRKLVQCKRLLKKLIYSMILRKNLFKYGVFFAGLPNVSSKNSIVFRGKDIYFGRNCHIGANIEVGNKVLFASGVCFLGGDHEFREPGVYIKDSGRQLLRTIVIEDDVWVGHGAIIMQGVTIECGAIVAAGAVVTKNVSACTIVGGNPARKIRDRFADEDKALHLRMLCSL
jgi:chloramphenicol O-acetyltransferase type B